MQLLCDEIINSRALVKEAELRWRIYHADAGSDDVFSDRSVCGILLDSAANWRQGRAGSPEGVGGGESGEE